MLRKIIRIDEEKCNGCGACAAACHEGAIGMIDGKAKLMREDYCDGLGACLPACPENAISFEEREAPAYNAAAVLESDGEHFAAAVLDNPHQDIPLIAVLRSPCFGFSADELSAIRTEDREQDFYTALCAAAEHYF